MRIVRIVVAFSVVALSVGALAAGLLSQSGAVRAEPASKKAAPKKKPAAAQAGREVYAAMPLAERLAIQFDLAWSGDYNGLVTGEFDDRSIAAVKSFQKSNTFKDTGVLNPQERALLSAASKTRQARLGWKMVDDPVTQARVGLPSKQAPNASRGATGTRWSSAQGQVQIETFRISGPGTTLAAVFEQQKREPPNRKLEVNLLRGDFFILSGLQGLKKFYVRAQARNGEVRGLTILYDQATEGVMDPLVVVMSSAFAPFPGTGVALDAAPVRRLVDYGTGIVVTAAGHIVTDRQLTQGCSIIQVSGHGDASRIAEDEASGLALLRVFGTGNLTPAPLVHEGAKGADLTLVGIADPQSQDGGRDATTMATRINGGGIEPSPPLGFSGAAALDGQGRLLGMVTLKTPVVAGAGPAVSLPAAATVPVDTIRRFLDVRYIAPATGVSGVDAIKASLVRVICVRK
jgi:peptidoglycan hydrolase-like protein with peptidoglycan-binding domain